MPQLMMPRASIAYGMVKDFMSQSYSMKTSINSVAGFIGLTSQDQKLVEAELRKATFSCSPTTVVNKPWGNDFRGYPSKCGLFTLYKVEAPLGEYCVGWFIVEGSDIANPRLASESTRKATIAAFREGEG